MLTGQPLVHLGEILHAEVAPRLGRAAGEGQVAVASKEYHPVTPVDAGRLVCREDDGDPALAEPAQQTHDVGRGRRIEPGGGFVEEEEAWPGQQLHGDTGPLALAAGQRTDRHLGPISQVEVTHGLLHYPVRLSRRRARGQP